MGRTKSPTRRYSARRYVDPQASRSSSADSELSSRPDDVSPSSRRGSGGIKQEPTAMDTESSSDGVQLPSARFHSLHSALPVGEDTRKGRKNRRKRRSSGDDGVVRRQEAAEDSSDQEEEQEPVVTISVAELEKWQQRVIMHIEDHFTNEQLKRIAEFGRVHGTVVQEAKQYVSNMEVQLSRQFEEERAALRAQAEEFVAKTSAENKALKRRVKELEQQNEGLEKQVDLLERQVDELTVEKAQVNQTRQQEEERHRNREQPAQTHSPSNHQTQVQPRKDGEGIGNTENRPVNGRQDEGRNEGGGQDPPLVVKKVSGGTIDNCSASKATDPEHHDPGSDKPQLHPLAPPQHHHQQMQPSSPISVPDNGAQSNPGEEGQSQLQIGELPRAPAGAHEDMALVD